MKRVRTASLSETVATVCLFQSRGFAATRRVSLCSAHVETVAEENGEGQTGYGFGVARSLHGLDAAAIADEGATRALRMLGAVRPKTGEYKAVLENGAAAELLEVLIPSFLSSQVAKGKSMFAGKVGERVAAGCVTISDAPLDPLGSGAEPFDGEGTASRRRELVSEGTLRGFLADAFWGRKIGTGSTGACRRPGPKQPPTVGISNLRIAPGGHSPSALNEAVGNGILLTEFLGIHTADPVSGDFSVGGSGIRIAGGALARPFVTHHNALDIDLYLRIAPELFLKRLLVGGMEKVFEINRNFRNEGISTRHNPEFTMLEFYEAYQDYTYLMDFTETMLRQVAEKVLGTTSITYQGREIDFAQPFARLTITQAIRKFHPQYTDAQLNDRAFLIGQLQTLSIAYKPGDGIGGLQLTLFDETVEHLLFDPTFIINYPAEVSPLARRNDINPEVTDRFELYIAGREIANGFSELNDPEDQAARFLEQAKAKEAGDAEAMHYDADYIRALEYGLPPTAGEGIGIDRLVMLLTDSPSIRDVILFPQLRRED